MSPSFLRFGEFIATCKPFVCSYVQYNITHVEFLCIIICNYSPTTNGNTGLKEGDYSASLYSDGETDTFKLSLASERECLSLRMIVMPHPHAKLGMVI